MKKRIIFVWLAAAMVLTSAPALADSIKGRTGVTGKIGFISPADNRSDFLHNRTDEGYIAGVGFIYGFDTNIAGEVEVTRANFGSETGDFGVTDVAFGAQYRFATRQRQLVPYLGVGMDFIFTDYDPNGGFQRDVESTAGAHVSAGLDYFLQRQLALTAEARFVAAPVTKITDVYGDHRGDFDPSNFSTMFGFRYFFN